MLITGKESLELSVIMPCRDEENTVGFCVDEAKEFFKKYKLSGEVIVVDNNSSDESGQIAIKHGAVVIHEARIGYGRAIRTGIANSRGRIIIMGDCDTTYDFLHLEAMYNELASDKSDVVIGNRYAGGIEAGAMSRLHRVGVRFLSFCGRCRFKADVFDFHCGLRGLSRRAAEQLEFHTDGMEFATEMIAQASKGDMRISQVPVALKKFRYEHTSKLRTIRDGFRHLYYIIRGR